MRRVSWLLLFMSLLTPMARAQTVSLTQWRSGTVGLTDGWRTHDGDNPAWAATEFNDSEWKTVDLDGLGGAQPGWRWFRLQVNVGHNHPDLHLLIDGGDGIYELYVNGNKLPGPALHSLDVRRPTERVVQLGDENTDIEIALRTFAPGLYAGWHLPLFLTASIGTPDAIENERAALESVRLYAALPSIAINLLLLLAGIGNLTLYRNQRGHAEYLWLGFYLFLLGTSNLFEFCSATGITPLVWNYLLGDPLIYLFTIMQINFTFSFSNRPVGRIWRVYQLLLLVLVIPAVLIVFDVFPTAIYILLEAFAILPAALLLPVLLFLWYRGGNREAGWIILPSLFPAATTALYDLGSASIYTGWGRADFLTDPIPIGPLQLQLSDLGDLLFVLSIAAVMLSRFTRVSREQARTAAELDAARDIQQRLVPASLPVVVGYHIEAAYSPMDEVGGDFYQILPQSNSLTLIVVGDVSGKGLKAAMTGALAIGALRTLAAEELGPADLLTRLNRQMAQARDNDFITCLCVRISACGEFTFANAGHLSPYRNGKEVIPDSGLPLGIVADFEYREQTLLLDPGDSLTLLSDGVVEARNAAGELFGFERTSEISAQSAQSIAEAACRFGQQDDITVLTLKRLAKECEPEMRDEDGGRTGRNER